MSTRILLFSAIAILLTTAPGYARPAHKQSLAQYFGPFLPKKLNDCVTCHVSEPPGKKFADGELYDIMANGKGRMPAYGTHNTPNEIWLMVDYIRSMSRN